MNDDLSTVCVCTTCGARINPLKAHHCMWNDLASRVGGMFERLSRYVPTHAYPLAEISALLADIRNAAPQPEAKHTHRGVDEAAVAAPK